MHVGVGLNFPNLDGMATDAEVYRWELALAARAEDAGFDSVWSSDITSRTISSPRRC